MSNGSSKSSWFQTLKKKAKKKLPAYKRSSLYKSTSSLPVTTKKPTTSIQSRVNWSKGRPVPKADLGSQFKKVLGGKGGKRGGFSRHLRKAGIIGGLYLAGEALYRGTKALGINPISKRLQEKAKENINKKRGGIVGRGSRVMGESSFQNQHD